MRIGVFFLLFFASGAALASAEPKPELYVDCSFTGAAGDLCKEATEAWAKKRGVIVHVEHRMMTSTEKLALTLRRLEKKEPKLDVFGVDVVWPGALHKDLLDLEPYFQKSIGSYLPLYISNNTVNNRLLAIPYYASVGLLFYRADLLKKHGMKVPETWEELTDTAERIQDAERAAGNKDLWGFVFQGKAYEGLTCDALEWVASHNGGTLLDSRGWVLANTTNALNAFKLASTWVGRISPPQVLEFAEHESYEFFKQGKAVFLRAWPSAWGVVSEGGSAIRDRVGIAAPPKGGPRGISAATLGGWSFAVSAKTKHPKLAAELLQYLTSPGEQKKLALLAGGSPVLTELYQDPEVLKAAPYYPLLLPTLSNAILRPARITRNSYPEVSQAIWETAHRVLSREEEPLPAISRLQNELEKLSKRWKR